MTPLSKYIAQSGYCSRRQAVALIQDKRVRVNGELVLEPAHRITSTDSIKVNAVVIRPEKLHYIILNKPRGYITTVSDERGRKTVLDLIGSRVAARIYPVGRLDRDTTGLLLLTNDGNLAQQLNHPRYGIKKSYIVAINKSLTEAHLRRIRRRGVVLEDGRVQIDAINFIKFIDRTKLVLTLHSGKNRVIRRLFKELGYVVTKLHRSVYADLKAKDLAVGQWRFLKPQELEDLH